MQPVITDASHRVLGAISAHHRNAAANNTAASNRGQLHRYRDIAQQSGVTLEQLDVALAQLVDAGIGLSISPGGVVFERTSNLSLLHPQIVQTHLATSVSERINLMRISAVCTSTNDVLGADVANSTDSFQVAISDAQTAGRGRQGNLWVSPFGGGIYMSLSTHWLQPSELSDNLPNNLPLAIGVAVAEQLQGLVADSIQLKWPNDLMANDQKLGGLLLESRAHPAGGYRLVIGLGINLATPDLAQPNSGIEPPPVVTTLPPIGLRALAANDVLPNRSVLTAMVLNAVIASVEHYRQDGFAHFHSRWQQRDYLYQRPVQMHARSGSLAAGADPKSSAQHIKHGIADGINADGTLRVLTDDGEFMITGGEVSVRCT